MFDELKQQGFSRIRLDGEPTRLDEESEKRQYPRLDKQKKHTIEAVVDRLTPSAEEKSRLFDSIQSALKVGNGTVVISSDGKDSLYSQRNACPHCNISLGDLEPRTFSFNSPFGACRECNGLGIRTSLTLISLFRTGQRASSTEQSFHGAGTLPLLDLRCCAT